MVVIELAFIENLFYRSYDIFEISKDKETIKTRENIPYSQIINALGGMLCNFRNILLIKPINGGKNSEQKPVHVVTSGGITAALK